MASVVNLFPTPCSFFFFPALSVNNGGAPSEGDAVALKSSQGPCANGPTSYDPEQPVPLGPTENSLGKEPASGVHGFHEHLKASRGGSDESLALRKDTLQSLKLSLPLQETELCKHLFTPWSPPVSFSLRPQRSFPPSSPQTFLFPFLCLCRISPEC